MPHPAEWEAQPTDEALAANTKHKEVTLDVLLTYLKNTPDLGHQCNLPLAPLHSRGTVHVSTSQHVFRALKLTVWTLEMFKSSSQ